MTHTTRPTIKRIAGEPIGNGPGCPQCGSSESLRWNETWDHPATTIREVESLRCKDCGLSGIRPHFAGVEEGMTE